MEKRNSLSKDGKRKAGMAQSTFFTLHFSFFIAAALLLASCGKDDIDGEPGGGTPPANGGDIRFEIGFTPQTRVATAADFTSQWEDGDAIGIFAVKHGVGLSSTATGHHIHNAKLTYSSAGGGSWSAESGSELWWPATAENIPSLDFYAYYPFDASATNPTAINFNVLTDQSAAGDYSKSDLLTAKSTGTSNNGWGKGQTVSLIFSHALAMVEVTLNNTVGAIDYKEDVIVKLVGVKPGAELNLGGASGPQVSLATADNEPSGITMYRVEQEGDTDYHNKYTFRALVPAQELAQDSRAALIFNGDMTLQSSALTAAVPLAAGQAEQFTQKIPVSAHPLIEAKDRSFQMGQSGVSGATPVHQVTFTKDFRMPKYQVTNAQYAVFLNTTGIGSDGQGTVYYDNTSYTGEFIYSHSWGVQWNTPENKWIPASGYENHPVINVTWYGAKAYADWVGGALPTEAQWEYACRAGTTTEFHFGDNQNDLVDYGWYWNNSSDGTKAVGQKEPNVFGLYDMHGNVWEWCSDWYGSYGNGSDTDPTGPASGSVRVLRGGSWFSFAQDCRSAYRYSSNPDFAFNRCGFRVVFVP